MSVKAVGGRLPLNLFGIPFGLAGLAGLWSEAAVLLGLPEVVPDAFWVVAAAAWVVTVGRYVRRAGSVGAVLEDLGHPVLGPFASLAVIVPTLFGERLHADFPLVGEVWVLVTAAASFGFGTWFVTRLTTVERDIDQFHSGYLLPTVAAGLISGQSLAAVRLHTLAVGAFGVGMLFWLLLGTVSLYRMAFRPRTHAALIPTYAIFSAPPAAAGNAWFAITAGGGGERIDVFQQLLLGTFLLLIAFQFLLVPTYLRLKFTLGFWALTFTTVASGRYGARLVADEGVPGATVWEWLITLAATGVVAAVGVASVRFTLRARHPAGTASVTQVPAPAHV